MSADRDSTAPARQATAEWPAGPLPREEHVQVLVYAGVWLIFLAIPAFSIVTGAAGPGLTVLGLAALAVFIAVYLRAFLAPWPVRGLPLWGNTALYTLLLALCVVAMVPAAGLTAWNSLPFLLAIWVFPHRMLIGIPVALGITVLGTVTALAVAGPDDAFWLIIPLAMTLVIIVSMRYAQEREDKAQSLQRELALSRQREQFARDVHDVLGHSLTVVTVKAELARRLVDANPERAKDELDDVLELTRRSLAEVRATVRRQHAPDLGDQLATARTALQSAGIEATVPAPGSVSGLDADQRVLFAWCLREAITNVIRHSRATECTVQITPRALTVTDDGVGTATLEAGSAPGDGLRGMRARVAEAGGTLTLTEARSGHDRPGARLEVTL